jgi:dienelactone hydrolase
MRAFAAIRRRILCSGTALGLTLAMLCSAGGADERGGSVDRQSVTVTSGRLTIECNVCLNDDFQPNQPIRLATQFYRPAGPGPFPLVVIIHGTPPGDHTGLAGFRPDFSRAARWFAARGFFVVIAYRPGFGGSEGRFAEQLSCPALDYLTTGRAIAQIESAIVRSAAELPSVDSTRIVVVGHSAGGFGAIALADDPPPGLVGVISFAGGHGSDGNGHFCHGAARLIAVVATFGMANQLPQLWLYAANDHFFPPQTAHAMARAYANGSAQPLTFVDLPAFDGDGHSTFQRADPTSWAPAVSAFLTNVFAAPSPLP